MTGSLFLEDWIRPTGGGGVIIGTVDRHLLAEDIPQIVAWIYQAAGTPSPIMLPRPKLGTPGGSGPGWHVTVDDGSITVRAVRLLPGEARTVAAVIASTADLAEKDSVPDPSEVERLAAFLDGAMDTDPVTLARRLLGGFDVKVRA